MTSAERRHFISTYISHFFSHHTSMALDRNQVSRLTRLFFFFCGIPLRSIIISLPSFLIFAWCPPKETQINQLYFKPEIPIRSIVTGNTVVNTKSRRVNFPIVISSRIHEIITSCQPLSPHEPTISVHMVTGPVTQMLCCFADLGLSNGFIGKF